MTIPFEALEAEALKLEPGDRARLAEHLIASLKDDPTVDATRIEELAQRIAALHDADVGFGLWREHPTEGTSYQDRIRRELTR